MTVQSPRLATWIGRHYLALYATVIACCSAVVAVSALWAPWPAMGAAGGACLATAAHLTWLYTSPTRRLVALAERRSADSGIGGAGDELVLHHEDTDTMLMLRRASYAVGVHARSWEAMVMSATDAKTIIDATAAGRPTPLECAPYELYQFAVLRPVVAHSAHNMPGSGGKVTQVRRHSALALHDMIATARVVPGPPG